MRFALTCRRVKPEFVDPADHWKGIYDIPYQDDDVQTSALDDTPAGVADTQTSSSESQDAAVVDVAEVSNVGEVAPLNEKDLVEPEKADASISVLEKVPMTAVSQSEKAFPVFF